MIALGVLAMTVGLIRTETVGDLRALTAMGANRRIRRSLTGATAGALGLLEAVLGTAVAYLAADVRRARACGHRPPTARVTDRGRSSVRRP